MFTHAPKLVQQRPVAPVVYERTPSHVPPLVSRSRAPSFHQSPASVPFPTRKNQSSTPPAPSPATRPSPEPWVDALKDDVEAEFSLSLVDDLKAAKDAALDAATSPQERAAIVREYDESMADIRAQARAEFQRRVEAERERRLLGNYQGKDALIAEQHNIMQSIVRENMRRETSPSSMAGPSLQTPTQAPPSQPIPIPVQRNRSRKGSVSTRSTPNTLFASSSSSSSSSSRPFPTGRRDSITQHPSTRPLPPPVASPATSVSSTSSLMEPSSSYGSYSAEVDRRYEGHRVAVHKLEEEVKRKEAAARRSAEEARRREEAAARHEEDARRKNEEATRRMREAQLREQQARALEARARKEMVLAQKEVEAVRARTQSRTQSAGVPLIAKVFSKDLWQQKPRPAAVTTIAPRRETKVRA